MRQRSLVRVTVLILSLGAGLAAVAHGKDKGARLDLIWTHPDLASFGIRSIAFMPAVSFSHDIKSEKAVEDAAAASLRALPYHWEAPRTVQYRIESDSAMASLWKAQRDYILKQPRVDSLAAPILCRALHTQALLTYRIDQYEQRDLEWNEAGKPSTSVQIKAALVDSAGRLVWSAIGSEIAEGALQDPNAGVSSVSGNGLTTAPVTGTGKAPAYDEVLSKLFARWAPRFPAPPAASGTP